MEWIVKLIITIAITIGNMKETEIMENNDIYVEPVTNHTIIVDSRKEIKKVSICPLIGGECSITLTFKEEE